MKKLLTASAMTAALFGAPLASQAATETETFDVLLTLLASCTINQATDMDFGTANETTVNGGTVTAESQISVTCSNGTAYDIGLSGTNADREMVSLGSGNSTVAYELYQNSARTTEWDDTSVVSDVGDGNQQDFPVYGLIPVDAATIDAADDIDGMSGINLQDTITVTVTF